MVFKKFDGTLITDLNKYILDFVSSNPNTSIHIGTDSQRSEKVTTFVTVICFYPLYKGVHIIYNEDTSTEYEAPIPAHRLKRGTKKDLYGTIFPRLWGEVERTKNVADIVTRIILENGMFDVPIKVHLDLNPNEMNGSNIVYSSGVGAILGAGYEVQTKPNAWAATKAADMLCR